MRSRVAKTKTGKRLMARARRVSKSNKGNPTPEQKERARRMKMREAAYRQDAAATRGSYVRFKV